MGSILRKVVGMVVSLGQNLILKKYQSSEKSDFAGNQPKFFRYVTPQEKNYFSKGQKVYEKLTTQYLKNNN